MNFYGCFIEKKSSNFRFKLLCILSLFFSCFGTAASSSVDENPVLAFQSKGTDLYLLRRYDEAIESYNAALAIPECTGKTRINVLYEKAYCLQFSDRWLESAEVFAAAYSISKHGSIGLYKEFFRIGVRLMLKEHYEDAISVYDQIINIQDYQGIDRLKALQQKGRCLHSLRLYDKALEVFEEVLSMPECQGQEQGKTLSWKGDVLYWLQRYNEAIALYNRALSIPEYKTGRRNTELRKRFAVTELNRSNSCCSIS